MTTTITIGVECEVRPWAAPGFAVPVAKGDEARSSIPVSALSVSALDALAGWWIADLYEKAGKEAPQLTRRR